jgi:hypothetical protein
VRESRALLSGAGEIEGLSGQLASLIGVLSEKARRFQAAWLASDHELKELRTRFTLEDHRRATLEAEKQALREEADHIRQRLSRVDGEKLASEEAGRTNTQALETKIRELDARTNMLSAEADALREEMTRARNEATGADLEARRARFEADRLKGEIESERMERLRIQRVLENREKELQVVQAKNAGQSSTLFLDELHRLVRRLESELDVRTAAAHEALAQLDRLPAEDESVAVVSNLRAALLSAAGNAPDAGDALKTLSRETGAPQGGRAAEPRTRADLVGFETSLATYDLSTAADLAALLVREGEASPLILMKKIYQCPSLRRAETADHLGPLTKLLEGLRTVQESSDRARGQEGPEADRFYVQLFDFLHNLVRLKLVTRATGDAWRLFLDLRGRFSFATSDKEWSRYRDEVLAARP